QASAQRSASTPENEADALIELTWGRQCASCHGPEGRGDGPNGPGVQAPDLARESWQATVTDDQIARTIRNGKNRMPKFDLPDAVVAGLVRRIRGLRSSGDAQP